jgi:drug/metabolite transporter (DMT)-like permease
MFLKEKVPRYTYTALGVSGVGAYLVLSPDPLSLELPHSSSDLLGIALALCSSLFLGIYMAWARKGTVHDAHPTAFHFQQAVTLVTVHGTISLISGEDWGAWRGQPAEVWVGFAVLVLVLLLGAAFMIFSLSRVNAALVSTLISWRLVVALVVAWPLLGERLDTLWQAVGALLVVATVTVYLAYQASHRGEPGTKI